MHPRIRELLDHLETQHRALRAAVDAVPVELRERRPSLDAWSVAEVIEHVAIIERRLAQRLDALVAEARARGVGPETDTSAVVDPAAHRMLLDRSHRVTAPTGAHPSGTVDAERAWAELEAAHATLRASVLAGDGLALGTVTAAHPRFGELDWYRWVAFAGGHEARHAAQIRDVATTLIGTD